MKKSAKVLAVIPARAGSKRVPKKNIRLLNRKPLIAWSIEAALKSEQISKVVVSTDSREIADIAKKYGAEVPFLRPPELSGDHAKSVDMLIHAIEYLQSNDERYDIVVLLQPTSPLRDSADIDEALRIKEENGAVAVISVSRSSLDPLLLNTLGDGDSMDDFIRPELVGKRSQDFKPHFFINGAIYAIDVACLLDGRTLFPEHKSIAYKMPYLRGIDIDEEEDFILAEALLQRGV